MAAKADFTPEEWNTIQFAPVNTALVVSLASPSGPIGIVKEVYAAVSSVVEIEQDVSASQLLKDLAADIRARKEQPELPRFSSVEEGKAHVTRLVREAVALLDSKAVEDAPAVKQWLYGVAEKAARAAKEGGFLGFGGTEVTEQEQAALAELAGILGVTQA
jgi:hypothetical protein